MCLYYKLEKQHEMMWNICDPFGVMLIQFHLGYKDLTPSGPDFLYRMTPKESDIYSNRILKKTKTTPKGSDIFQKNNYFNKNHFAKKYVKYIFKNLYSSSIRS